MISLLRSAIARRTLTGSLFLGTALTACAAQAASFTMYRDPNCGCCLAWAEHVEGNDEHDVKSVEHPDIASLKAENGVPGDLLSCHTAVVEGYVIEGHVPIADVDRLLAERPASVKGLAVAGMPVGSPGMENRNHRQAFQVIAFGPDGRTVWASYPASQ